MTVDDSLRLRWAINIGQWHPTPSEWAFLESLVGPEEGEAVSKFKHEDDRKRALVSRLLARRCCNVVLGVPYANVQIKRTKGKKPFLANKGLDKKRAPNFNFSVSHEGDFVVLATEPTCICGVDVAAPQQIRKARQEPIEEFFKSFDKVFTKHEWEIIRSVGPDEKQLSDAFQRNWSLKEAFVKARGDGLAFDIGTAEFRFDQGVWSDTASVSVGGKPMKRWKLFLQRLGDSHWVSVARGPPEAMIDAFGEFRKSLQKPAISEADIQEALAAPNPPFSIVSMVDLVPEDMRAGYEAAGGELL